MSSDSACRAPRAIGYRLLRWLAAQIARPRIAGAPQKPPPDALYALPGRSWLDLAVLDILAADRGWPDPWTPLQPDLSAETPRFVFLTPPKSGGWRRRRKRTAQDLGQHLRARQTTGSAGLSLMPVQIFWGQAPQRQGSLVRTLFPETWAGSGRLRRPVILLADRRHIVLHLGAIVSVETPGESESAQQQQCTLALQAQWRSQRTVTLGPDLSHRRTLLEAIPTSDEVVQAITQAAANETERKRLAARARKHAEAIASDMSYPAIRLLERLLSAFVARLYTRIRLRNLEAITTLAQTHTLIYLPAHRSHMDYLLLSLLLFQQGLALPHIAAGENLNLPFAGQLLRRCGAFFMRRSFHEDPLYAAVFSQYLRAVFERGHSVEFFIEGGRSRTGRLLPARLGLLGITLDCARNATARPLALAPIYIGYERLIEGRIYVDELGGMRKRQESLGALLRSVRLFRARHGQVDLSFGDPIMVDQWANATAPAEALSALGAEVLKRINQAAVVNPVNLAAMALMATPRLAMQRERLDEQIDCILALLQREASGRRYHLPKMSGAEVIDYLLNLSILVEEGKKTNVILTPAPDTAPQLAWFGNNTAHLLALPALLAYLLQHRNRPVRIQQLTDIAERVFPYIASELHADFEPGDSARWMAHLQAAGLVGLEGQQASPPPPEAPAHYRLHLLAGLIRPLLERQYILLARLMRPGARLTRSELTAESQRIARRMARTHAINAPDFADARPLSRFVDQLIANGLVREDADGRLDAAEDLSGIMRLANRVLDPQFRYGVLHG